MRADVGPALPALRTAAIGRINAAADRAARAAGAGQSVEDRATETEARALLAAQAPAAPERAFPFVPAAGAGWQLTAAPDPSAFPLVAAEASARLEVLGGGLSLEGAARAIVAEADAWRATASAIRELRRTAVLRVEAATSPAAVVAAEAIEWPTLP